MVSKSFRFPNFNDGKSSNQQNNGHQRLAEDEVQQKS